MTTSDKTISFDLGAAQLQVPERDLLNAWFAKILDTPAPATFSTPALGERWQGGIYAGIVRDDEGGPDYHLIVSADDERTAVTWTDAMKWASELRAAGHADWALPNRQEARVLWANAQQRFAKEWYWLRTQSAGGESGAWCQGFDDGYQGVCRKDGELRARAVRRLPIQ
ncbi:MAG TPA: DUF1566 domain-containing protein [Burkholderiaceae bacterium]|nr:DUF1566 domain-containing protein [Burkholderiaceae bacterium]